MSLSIKVIGGYSSPPFYTHKLRGVVLGADDAPKIRRVSLLRERSEIPGNLAPPNYEIIHTGRSASDGSWAFERIPSGETYTAIAYDDTGQFDPVIKAGLIPEPME